MSIHVGDREDIGQFTDSTAAVCFTSSGLRRRPSQAGAATVAISVRSPIRLSLVGAYAPSVTAGVLTTFVFADVEGLTGVLDRLGDSAGWRRCSISSASCRAEWRSTAGTS